MGGCRGGMLSILVNQHLALKSANSFLDLASILKIQIILLRKTSSYPISITFPSLSEIRREAVTVGVEGRRRHREVKEQKKDTKGESKKRENGSKGTYLSSHHKIPPY
jgi:hypothetical protein